jgi:hypothetical protein
MFQDEAKVGGGGTLSSYAHTRTQSDATLSRVIESVRQCDASDDAPLVVYVSKVSMSECE